MTDHEVDILLAMTGETGSHHCAGVGQSSWFGRVSFPGGKRDRVGARGYAVPGRTDAALSQDCHELIRVGATLVTRMMISLMMLSICFLSRVVSVPRMQFQKST